MCPDAKVKIGARTIRSGPISILSMLRACHSTKGPSNTGAVQLHTNVNHEIGEYAILLRSDLKGMGLRVIEGEVLRENGRYRHAGIDSDHSFPSARTGLRSSSRTSGRSAVSCATLTSINSIARRFAGGIFR
jgi:hypothetical protein